MQIPVNDQWEMKIQWNPVVFKKPETYKAAEYNEGNIKAVFFNGLAYHGKPARIFAYIGA
ncbi:MAG: hypothetical protein A2Y21_03875 [Clostridiales bacterium GWC2_40_7]|nr:MAG: hypothetical protein A2Y21_03875 [Clostridiales bacterium GWC2_40_7]